MDRYEHLHPVVATQLLEVPSTENVAADCPVAHHHAALARGPDIAVSIDYFGPIQVTPRGNTYILLFTDRFSRRGDMYAVTAAELTAKGTADILINRYIPLWGCPRSISSRTTAPIFRTFEKLLPAPTTQTATVGWNV